MYSFVFLLLINIIVKRGSVMTNLKNFGLLFV
jgi:hypothetical protein